MFVWHFNKLDALSRTSSVKASVGMLKCPSAATGTKHTHASSASNPCSANGADQKHLLVHTISTQYFWSNKKITFCKHEQHPCRSNHQVYHMRLSDQKHLRRLRSKFPSVHHSPSPPSWLRGLSTSSCTIQLASTQTPPVFATPICLCSEATRALPGCQPPI